MTATPVHQPVKTSLIMLAGGLLITLMVVFARLAAEHHAIIEITFWRNIVGALCMAGIIAASGQGVAVLKTRRPMAHLVRGVVGLVGLCLNFYAVTLLPLAEQTALFFAMPLMTALLAMPLLRERMDARRWAGILVGLAGIVITTRPHGILAGEVSALGVAVSLGGAFFTALVAISLRSLGATEPENRTVFYFFTLAAAISACFLPWYWTAPTAQTALWLVLSGITGTAGQVLMTRAHAMAPAGFLSPFHYVSILYSTALGWLVWGEWPHMAVFVGAGVVIAAGLLALALERGRRPTNPTPETEAGTTYG